MVVERLWDEWQALQAEAAVLGAFVQVPAEDSAHHDRVFDALCMKEAELESQLPLCRDRRLSARIRMSIALRQAQVAGEEREPHWQLVADALADLSTCDG